MAEIVTDRLRLRPPGPRDVDALHALASDFEVVKQTATWPWPPDRSFTASRCVPVDPGTGVAGPVFLGDRLVGMMGITETGSADRRGGEMGYMFARAHWGRGYATEIGRALIAHAWACHDWPEIRACVFDDNPASARVLEKLGFDAGARCAGPCAARGGPRPMRRFCLRRP